MFARRVISRRVHWLTGLRSQLLYLLAGLLVTGLGVRPLLSQSVQFPTYRVGANSQLSTGPKYPPAVPSPWVVGNGQIITPAGSPVYLGIRTRAKAIALNPNFLTHTAAVLQMGGPQAVTIFNTRTGAVMQTYSTPYLSGSTTKNDSSGSSVGIAYSPDGLHLLFSQDSSHVTIASVDPSTGMITSTGGTNSYPTQVSVPIDVDKNG